MSSVLNVDILGWPPSCNNIFYHVCILSVCLGGFHYVGSKIGFLFFNFKIDGYDHGPYS